MGKIISEVSVKLTKTLDQDVATALGEHIEEDVEDILKALSEESFIYLGKEDGDDQADS